MNPGEKTNEETNPAKFKSTLPMAPKPKQNEGEEGLDLQIDDVQTRLPYGSEDIADK